MHFLVIISGVSVSGKTYILQNKEALCADLHIVRKKTTRMPRKTETDFEFDFNCDLEEVKSCDCFYSFRNALYGFDLSAIENILKEHNAIMVVRSTKIILKLQKAFPNSVAILCVPRNIDKAETQLRKKHAPDEEIQLRLYSKAETEIKKEYESYIDIFDKVIVNDYDEKFLADIKSYLERVERGFKSEP